jgi:hypothetical protein
LLRHAEIDNVNDVCSLGAGSTDQEIVRLDIAIDEILLVDGLDSRELEQLLVPRQPVKCWGD